MWWGYVIVGALALLVGFLIGQLGHPLAKGWALRAGATPATLEECTVAHARGQRTVRLPLELVMRLCGLEPDVSWFKVEPGRRRLLRKVVGDKLRSDFDELHAIDVMGDDARHLRRFAVDAMQYVEVLEDELAHRTIAEAIEEPRT